ncbi:MAG: O-antigen ligase family protein [Gammaproteobacteria bacterium]
MLFYIAVSVAIIALATLLVSPTWGFLVVLAVKPVIDSAWAVPLIDELRLTQLFSVAVATVVFFHLFVAAKSPQALRYMPLRVIWLAYIADVTLFSLVAVVIEGPLAGLNMFFRHINGFVGFYVVQAFFHDQRKLRLFLMALVLAGVFPISVGVLEAVGVVNVAWRETMAEGLPRNIGFYHDAFTARYYAQQTILALLVYTALYMSNGVASAVGRCCAFLYGLASLIVLYKTYSKSAIVTLTLWTLSWTTLQRKFITLSILSVAVLVGLGYYAQDIAEEIGTIFHKEVGFAQGVVEIERTFTGRWYGWKDLMDEWTDFGMLAKLFGSGHIALGAHNDYLLLLVHGGFVGLVIYVSLLIATGWKIMKNVLERREPLAVAALMVFVMWMVDTIGLVASGFSGYQWFIWGIIGVSFRIRQNERRTRIALERKKTDTGGILLSHDAR